MPRTAFQTTIFVAHLVLLFSTLSSVFWPLYLLRRGFVLLPAIVALFWVVFANDCPVNRMHDDDVEKGDRVLTGGVMSTLGITSPDRQRAFTLFVMTVIPTIVAIRALGSSSSSS